MTPTLGTGSGMADEWNRTQWPRPINEPDLWRVVAAVLLGILIGVVIVVIIT